MNNRLSWLLQKQVNDHYYDFFVKVGQGDLVLLHVIFDGKMCTVMKSDGWAGLEHAPTCMKAKIGTRFSKTWLFVNFYKKGLTWFWFIAGNLYVVMHALSLSKQK